MVLPLVLYLAGTIADAPAAAGPRPARAVVELFTAQGCPACPAADVAMRAVADRPDVIALTLPVTYWDARGWADPLARAAYTERQRRYAAIGRREAATPQFVIDGRFATSDVDPGGLGRAIDAARRRGGPAIGVRGGRLTVGGDARTARPATVWLADYEPRPLSTPVRAGLTRGRVAVQYHVVRRFRAIGRWIGTDRAYRLPALQGRLRRAVIVQSADGGAIIAAAPIG